MAKSHLGDHRVRLVAQVARPSRRVDPRKLPVCPHAEALEMTTSVIGLSDVRPVEVAHAVLVVESDEHFAVSDRDIAGHSRELSLGTWDLRKGKLGVSSAKRCDALDERADLRHANAEILADFHRAP